MLKFNKYLIIFLALLIVCTGVAFASDVDNSTDASVDAVSTVVSDSTPASDTQVTSSVNNDNNLKKETKNVKRDENNPVIVTTNEDGQDNFDDLFDVISDENDTITVHQIKSEYSGDTIKINTDITRNDNSYIINVPITLTSDYNNTINLNTYNSYETGVTFHWTSLNFTNGASGSNITNIQFHDAQVFVLNASDIKFDSITVSADQPYGKGTGLFAICDISVGINVTNSYFNINNNGGISVIALTNGHECLIDHNNIIGTGSVGNLIYLNTYFLNNDGEATNRHNTISYNTLTGPTTPVNTCFAIAIAGPDNTIEHNDIYYSGTGITTTWQGSYDEEIIELDENDFVTVYEGNKYYYNNLYNGASFTCGNYSVVENNYISGTSNFAGHSNVTSNTLLNTITVHNNVRFHSNTATGQIVNVKKANSCFKDNSIGSLKFTYNKAKYTYDCGGNTIGSIPNYSSYFISCNGNCPNCESTITLLSKKFNNNLKTEESNILFSDDELVIYNNGTAILTITGNNQQYLTGKTNEVINEYENIDYIVMNINSINWSTWKRQLENFNVKLGTEKNKIDLKIVWNMSGNTLSYGFKFEDMGYKSVTYEDCFFYIKHKSSDLNFICHWGFYSNLNFINCNFKLIPPDFDDLLGPNSYYFYESDELNTDNCMSIVGENVLFKNCNIDLMTFQSIIEEEVSDESYLTNIIVFDKANNITFDNNTLTLGTIESDSSIPLTDYGTFLNRTVNNLTFINNNVIVRYTMGINLKTNNSLFENNTISVIHADKTIELIGNNNIIRYNTLTSSEDEGDNTVSVIGENNIVEQNPYVEIVEPILKVDTTEFIRGTNSNITASIYIGDDLATNISKGKITFKVNGKTLKDINGKVIYAKLENGTATIKNYTILEDWKENSTIQAIYSGSSDLAKMSSEKQNITITQEEPTITTEDINTTKSSTITLKATINTNTIINTGKVVFKINGKTLKDTNGKVIYAKVANNTVSVEYALPESYKNGEYNITAVFVSTDYPKLEDVKSLFITA